MDKRELTGNWYLKKRTFGGFDVMVEVKIQFWDDPSYGNGGGCYTPERVIYEKAETADLIKLSIITY